MLRLLLLAFPLLVVAPMVLAQDEKPAQVEPKAQAGTIDLADIFKKLDKDNDGKLSPDEFKALAELPEVKARLTGARPNLPANFDLEKLKEKLGPERFEKLKEKLGGKLDPEKLKELLEKRKNKNP